MRYEKLGTIEQTKILLPIPTKLRDKLDVLAERNERSRSAEIRFALRKYTERAN